MGRTRLDELLVARELLPDLKTAQAWILAGDVLVDGRPSSKPGTPVAAGAQVSLRRPVERYASRGGLKLEAALARFAVPVAGAVVLDAGASTGGFTDCLLQHGADRVYAVDVGFGQLRGKLASDPRVVNLERTNISDLTIERLAPPIDLCTFDLSYLSARKAIPILARLFRGSVQMVGLIKPLFEGVPGPAMADPRAVGPALLGVLEALPAALAAHDVMVSPILGSNGTLEFLVHLAPGPAATSPGVLCDRALAAV
jgi:23S rRNA (cytidine1920-2'-O)/16S rRNA (cytidine1409-2'-O)-methyltransferase